MLLDAHFFTQLQTLPSLPFARLVRQDPVSLTEAATAVMQRGQSPTFSYQSATSLNTAPHRTAASKLRNQLAHAPSGTLRTLYEVKLDEYELQLHCLEAIARGDDETVTAATRTLFRAPKLSPQTIEAALLRTAQPHDEEKCIGPDALAELASTVIATHNLQNIRVTFWDGNQARLTRGKQQSTLALPRTRHYSTREAIRLLTHELEVHALRTHHAAQQPFGILYRGTANYLCTEEGLALWATQPWASSQSSGLWQALAVALATQATLLDTFAHLTTLRQARGTSLQEAQQFAWGLCVRTYRGIQRPNRPGLGFCRDHVYYTGLQTVRGALNEEPALINYLFAGHLGIEDIAPLSTLGMQPRTPPTFVSERIVHTRYA